MLAGQGIDLDVSTLVHWISRLAWWLKPLHGLLTASILAHPKIFCDDTPLPVLDRTRKRTRVARLWSYAMDDRPWRGPAPPAVVYLYAEDRKGRHVDEHLLRFNGVLQVDAYAGYNRLTKRSRAGGSVTLAGSDAGFYDRFEHCKARWVEETLGVRYGLCQCLQRSTSYQRHDG